MARPVASAQQRSLTLTEELERLEQSITLTLQEIDHNFSKAHRIVTSSILPIVEQYANHSKDVWEGSKFWKQFFESSANVSLSGYEEQSTVHESTAEETVTEDSNATAHTSLEETSNSYETPSAQHISTSSIADLDLSNLSMSPSHSTPRPNKKQAQPAFADYPSPYEALRQEVNNATANDASTLSQTNNLPETPGRTVARDVAMTPEASPTLPRLPMSITRPSTTRKRTDPLLHRVLDKTYRIQATPLTTTRHKSTSMPGRDGHTRGVLLDDNLSSSPEVAPPQLHAEIFDSPEHKRKSPRKLVQQQQQQPPQRTPGISVLTPARNRSAAVYEAPSRTPGIWDSDDDDDDIDEVTGMPYGASPPKTMQFHIPQSGLLKTPAKEASKRIVNDILETAGINRTKTTTTKSRAGEDDNNNTDDLDLDLDLDVDLDYDIDVDIELDDDEQDFDNNGGETRGRNRYDTGLTNEHSPTIVRRAPGFEDETF